MTKKKPNNKKPSPKKASWKKKIVIFSLKLLIALLLILTVVIFILVSYYSADLPSLNNIHEIKKQPTITILDTKGTVLATYGDMYGRNLKYHEIPDNIKHAVLAIEDRRFFNHIGIDFIGLLRAMYANKQAGKMVQGGSTITQQLAKISFLSSERTLKRKIQELLIAFQLEKKFSKQEILRIYLNRVYLGKGNFGIDAASKYYFGKYPEHLTLYEAAMLAGMLKAPSKYSPQNNMKLALGRTKQVLIAMNEAGYIPVEAVDIASLPRIMPRGSARGALKTPYFADYVLDEANKLLNGIPYDIKIYTTLDLEVQQKLEQAIFSGMIGALKQFKATESAGIVMDKRGQIRGMVGGVNYQESQFNRATQAKRQSGSSFKLLVYLAALEAGYTPESMVEDSKITINKWSPRNFTRKYLGEVTLEQAFAYSINTVAVKISENIGRYKVIEMARRLGITERINNVPSIALGTEVTTLDKLTAVFATIANEGILARAHGILKITTNDNTIIYRHSNIARQVLELSVVTDIKNLMASSVAYGTSKNAMIENVNTWGKTGTTQDYRDALFIGFSSNLVAGIWVGNDDNSPMKGVTGGNLPIKIWHDFMSNNLSPAPSVWDSYEEAPKPSVFDSIGSFFTGNN